ncbi:unknown [Clostridium sp. CAG:307]|nr:unknown [Clostridium sp. CAG:307]
MNEYPSDVGVVLSRLIPLLLIVLVSILPFPLSTLTLNVVDVLAVASKLKFAVVFDSVKLPVLVVEPFVAVTAVSTLSLKAAPPNDALKSLGLSPYTLPPVVSATRILIQVELKVVTPEFNLILILNIAYIPLDISPVV